MSSMSNIVVRPRSGSGLEGVVDIILSRPQKANAFNMSLIEELKDTFIKISDQKNIRLVQVMGAGKHFCAGADLEWMKQAASLDDAENEQQTRVMAEMFRLLYELPVVTVARVHGSVYGGGLGICAACDFVIAEDSTQFCLSEVKLGLIPAVIFPYLKRKISSQFLRYACYSACPIDVHHARQHGLVDLIISTHEDGKQVEPFISQLLLCGSQAQRKLKNLEQKLNPLSETDIEMTCKEIAEVRKQPEAVEGLRAFLNKQVPAWRSIPVQSVDLGWGKSINSFGEESEKNIYS